VITFLLENLVKVAFTLISGFALLSLVTWTIFYSATSGNLAARRIHIMEMLKISTPTKS
jgi:hypothetical protein